MTRSRPTTASARPDKKNKKPKKNKKSKKPQPIAIDKDWSISLGAGGTVGAGFFPAKFSFGTTGESCNDYVVYNTSLAGLSAVAATGTGTFANNTSVAGNTVVINGVTLTATGVGTDTFTAEPASGSHDGRRHRYLYVDDYHLHCVHADGDDRMRRPLRVLQQQTQPTCRRPSPIPALPLRPAKYRQPIQGLRR